jgi:hypothetical protein
MPNVEMLAKYGTHRRVNEFSKLASLAVWDSLQLARCFMHLAGDLHVGKIVFWLWLCVLYSYNDIIAVTSGVSKL